MGVRLVAMSGDSPERLRDLKEASELDYDVLSDIDLEAAKALGLAFHVEDEYVDLLKAHQYDLEGNSISTEQILPVPAVFVVNARGIITFSYVNPTYQIRCDPDVVLAAARAVVKSQGR